MPQLKPVPSQIHQTRLSDADAADWKDLQSTVLPKLVGATRPHLLDWDNDGNTDLVVGELGNGPLWLCRGPLQTKIEFIPERIDLVRPEDTEDVHYCFNDFNDDGSLDLLVATVKYKQDKKRGRVAHYSIDWYRNTTDIGVPVFADRGQLLSIPQPWRLTAFTVVDWNEDGRKDIIVSVIRGDESDGYIRQLWLYPGKA